MDKRKSSSEWWSESKEKKDKEEEEEEEKKKSKSKNENEKQGTREQQHFGDSGQGSSTPQSQKKQKERERQLEREKDDLPPMFLDIDDVVTRHWSSEEDEDADELCSTKSDSPRDATPPKKPPAGGRRDY